MVKQSVLLRLRDICDVIDEALEILGDVDLAGYEGDVGKRRGVER